MAKAKEIVGLDCGADAREWAVTVLQTRFEEMLELRDAAVDFSDIEGVHAMRVAARRLRGAVRDFLPLLRKRPLKNVRAGLKQLADALGTVRDQDVAILALEKLRADAETRQIKFGIEELLMERRMTRETARADLMEFLAAENIAELQREFAAALEKAAKKTKPERAVSFNHAGRQAVAASLTELCDLGISLYAPFAIEPLHELRIAAKRLRYGIELFVACWGDVIEPFADEIAQMQTALGEVHDCDVWIDDLGGRLGRENNRANTGERQAAVWLLSEFVKKRTKSYRSALEQWNDWQANNFAARMRTVIA